MGTSLQNVEKDFWVTEVLDLLLKVEAPTNLPALSTVCSVKPTGFQLATITVQRVRAGRWMPSHFMKFAQALAKG
jgi:hypothetical protein